MRDAKKLLSRARAIATKYSDDVGKKADEALESQWKNLGLGVKELQGAKRFFKASAASILNRDGGSDDGGQFSDAYVVDEDNEIV